MNTPAIENRVANSPLVLLNLEDYAPTAPRLFLDLAPFLQSGLVLREKTFRQQLKEADWQAYADTYVAIGCTTDAIVPSWAFTLTAVHLAPYALRVVVGTLDELEKVLFQEAIARIHPQDYQDQKVILKGCSERSIPIDAYAALAQRLQPYVASLMYGEPCSTVPLYKRKPPRHAKEQVAHKP